MNCSPHSSESTSFCVCESLDVFGRIIFELLHAMFGKILGVVEP